MIPHPDSRFSIEVLESRIAPATLVIDANGSVTYTAGAGVTNALSISISGDHYVFADSEPITVSGAGAGNFTGSGGNSVSGLTSAIFAIGVDLGDQNDTCTLSGLSASFSFTGGAGTDTFSTSNGGGSVTLNGNGSGVSISAETVSLVANASFINTGPVSLTADTLQIDGDITAGQVISIKSFTPSRVVSLGFEFSVATSLTQSEISHLHAPLLVFTS